ncbi:viral A-type inclusion protein [Reticulomyxa filosa]|uniref:Viral A-type inclusion protein n=1 Tax=Reticulomyxa filosa TaxID=46433 RepID=X6LR76_RETFI|nr:viral A-type inclusion protein [Reticulomyxa filosa]|eukprot:ETO03255.1 viral A-type inclusion protein [Reticulomyxa filosa]
MYIVDVIVYAQKLGTSGKHEPVRAAFWSGGKGECIHPRTLNKTKQNREIWSNDYPILADDKLAHETTKRLANVEKTIVQHSAQFTDLMEKKSKTEQSDKKKIRHLKEQNNQQKEQIETLKRENEKQIGKMVDLKKEHEQQIKKLQEEKQQLQTQANSMTKKHEQSVTENETHKDELHKYQHKIKQLESEFQALETQLKNTKTKLHEYVLLTEKNRSSLSSLHLEKDSAINELENCRQQFNELKEYYFVLLFIFFLTIYNLYL